MSEVITMKDLWKEIAGHYTKLGYKLDELKRLYDKAERKLKNEKNKNNRTD